MTLSPNTKALAANEKLDGAASLLLQKIYCEIVLDRAAVLDGRGTDLELAGLACIEPLNTNGPRPSESLSTY